MTPEDFVHELLLLPDAASQRSFLDANAALLDDAVADALKREADRALRADCQRSLQIAHLLQTMGSIDGNPCHRALGLRAEGNCRCLGGLGEYERAVELYDEAAECYREAGDALQEASSQIGKLWALSNLGRYGEAHDTYQRVACVFVAQGQWRQLGAVTLNLGVMLSRMGRDAEALALYDRAEELYLRLGADLGPAMARVDHNRAVSLRTLGRFAESLRASQKALDAVRKAGERIEVARAQQGMALTYYVLGRYNEALEILDEVRQVFLDDGRPRDAIVVDLFISDTFLQLRRFADVLDTCGCIESRLAGLGIRFEVGQTCLNAALAHAGLGQTEAAMASLERASGEFAAEGNQAWLACADVERANLLLQSGEFEQSLEAALACAGLFQGLGLPVREAQAHLIAGRAEAALGHDDRALNQIAQALAIAEQQDLPPLAYQCHQLLGAAAALREDHDGALAEYERSIAELERMRGRLMVEFRSGFLEDKQGVYEEAAHLSLEAGQPERALAYAERAKSRALLELLAYRLDLGIRERSPADRPLVEELVRLRAERDRLYRRWEGREEAIEEGWSQAAESRQRARQDVLAIERHITDLWHRLLIRNAAYAHDASLCQVRAEPVHPYLSGGAVLIEYYAMRGRLVAFCATADSLQATWLPGDLEQVRRLIQLLWLNLRAVPHSPADRLPALTANVQSVLHRLYSLLWAPLAPALTPDTPLIVVPHGPLHYLPFHALYDGAAYLLERHEISTLPGASLLRYCHEAPAGSCGALAMGHSWEGRLPHALREAEVVAGLLGSAACLEDAATLVSLREAAPGKRVVHLAAHGEFRADTPLFSGLRLADGWLTTLDIFGLRLQASLVALSACQTGQSVVGGGDELLGLMRALLYAGAASVLLSLWAVEDRSTAQLMEWFYGGLAQGETKGTALRGAQRRLLAAEDGAYAHPYFWAPFCLVGDAGPL